MNPPAKRFLARRWSKILAIVLLGGIALRVAIPWLSQTSAAGGVVAGKLAPCPNSPNCVATESSAGTQAMEPIPCQEAQQSPILRVREQVESLPGTRIISQTDDYLHAIFRTRWLGFVDDVEFRYDAATDQLHFRSASRLGHSDLGTNRRRMDAFRARWGSE